MTTEMWIWQVVGYLILISAAVIVFFAIGKTLLYLPERADDPYHRSIESSMRDLLNEDRVRKEVIHNLRRGRITEHEAERVLVASDRRSLSAKAEHKLAIRGLTGKW